jgi:hypothetical protein
VAAWRHGVALRHYSISVVRGHGVDDNALSYILDRHDAAAIQFVDGWTGKGSMRRNTWRGHCGFRCSSATTSTSFAPETPTA